MSRTNFKRTARVASLLREVLTEVLRTVKDPRVSGVSVTDVEVTGDLREATQGTIELFPISGGSGEEYTFNSGGYVTKAYVNPVRSTDNRKRR